MKISVSLNNRMIETVQDVTLAELLASNGYNAAAPTFAVAVNSEFVPRESYPTRLIGADDKIDVVRPVSGG